MACKGCGKKGKSGSSRSTKKAIQKLTNTVSPIVKKTIQEELILRSYRLNKCQLCKLYDHSSLHCSICECKDMSNFEKILLDKNEVCPMKVW